MTAQDVLDFWFGAPGSAEYGKPRKAWFTRSQSFDDEVRGRFLNIHAQAGQGTLDQWQEDPQSLLALIIVLDQFPRNMFRDQARSFGTDALALKAARRMVAQAWDRKLPAFQRTFVYLPFEHTEDLPMQEQAVALFESDPELADGALWARKHRDIIARFGRFPHRNAILGRCSTSEEIEFLKQPGSSF